MKEIVREPQIVHEFNWDLLLKKGQPLMVERLTQRLREMGFSEGMISEIIAQHMRNERDHENEI